MAHYRAKLSEFWELGVLVGHMSGYLEHDVEPFRAVEMFLGKMTFQTPLLPRLIKSTQ